ncbi:MAG TPA: methyltransferase domain-containing protein, partial [Patescibacteria group bacterium]
MKEQLEPVFVRSKQKIEYGDDKYTPAQLLSQRINNQREQGWWFPAGDPEFWKFSDKLLIKGGKALDLGLGFGKSAFFFAINGMNVTGYETSQPAIKVVKSLKQIFNLPIEIKEEDFAAADLGKNIYDTVFLAQTLVHSPSEEAAFELINKAIKALKPCGRIWIRTSGIYDGA